MILNGKEVSQNLLIQLKSDIKTQIDKSNRVPALCIIQVGDNPASNSYIKSKIKKGTEAGINVILKKYQEDETQQKIIDEVLLLNNDETIDGVIIQQPLPKSMDAKLIMSYLSSDKDADGFSVENAGKLFLGDKAVRPATPQGIVILLNEYGINVSGLNAVVIGRSNIVGMPIAKMLLDLNATVTICHSKTKNIKHFTKTADLIVCAIGKPFFLKDDMVKKGSIIIDVGINKVDGAIVGDVDFNSLQEKVKYITPVPGGIGPLTVYCLLLNTYTLYLKHLKSK
jgi:methylenetetrahydrofolate dehydrogenase (NADP+)/methenyltetrahydrofolate cyclohydrolase